MKNKKGFTLIELLAVIAILAILLIIAIPSVIKMYNNAKENTFVDESQSILNTATKQFMAGQLDNNGSSAHYCYDGTANSNPLDLSGNKDVKYNVFFIDGQVKYINVVSGAYSIVQSGDKIDTGTLKDAPLNKENTENIDCTKGLTDLLDTGSNVLIDKIFSDNGYTKISVPSIDVSNLNNTSEASGENGLFKSTDTNSGNPTYFFRGNVTNNYIQFGEEDGTPIMWRIVRINEDESIRLIKDTSIMGNTIFPFNSPASATQYLYYSNTQTYTPALRAKPGVEGWYLDYLLVDYDDYIVPTQFCEEARVGFSTSFTDGLGNALIPYNEYTPTFKCATDANGKGILANEPKIGLITYDEVVFAGGYYEVANSSYYLHYVNSFSTMSTAGYSTSANYWYIGANGSIKYDLSNFSVNIRPVISIKSDFEVTGTGTSSNPYVIEF